MQTRPYEPGLRHGAPRRHGAASAAGLLGTIAVLGGLAAVAIVFRPGSLRAGSPEVSAIVPARVPAHQRTLDALARLVGESRAVLGIIPEGDSPFTEIVLWFDDVDGDRAVDGHEVLVVSHSRLRRVITLYRLPGDASAAVPPEAEADVVELSRALRGNRDAERWIFGPDGLEATGISDLRVEPASDPEAKSALIRITLSWAVDSSDGPDSASVVTGVRMRRPSA